MSAVQHAVCGDHKATARVLWLEGADVSALNRRKRSALHYALEDGNQALAKYIVTALANINAVDTGGDTPLHLATACSDIGTVQTLLPRVAGVSAKNKKRRTTPPCCIQEGMSCYVLRSMVCARLKASSDPSVRR